MKRTKPAHDADAAIEALLEAARLNLNEPRRHGSVIRLPGYGQAVMTGDLHGHHRNFAKLRQYAMLDRVPARHVILHEMIHADVEGGELDTSHELLVAAARYKCEFPDQVHFLQSNHELAQLTAYPIAKNGRAVIEQFNYAVEAAYGARGREVLAAINDFIASFPIAITTENRVWMSHSLPNHYDMSTFDMEIFQRPLTPEDLKTDRSVFQLVWGRHHTKAHIDALADQLGVDVFITGHQPQEMGHSLQFDRLIILASDHNHGTFLPFDLARRHTAEELIRNIRKFVAVA